MPNNNQPLLWWASITDEEKQELVNRFVKPGKDIEKVTEGEIVRIYSYTEEEE